MQYKHLTSEGITNNHYAMNYFQLLSMLFLTIMLGTYVLAYKMISVGGYVISAGIFIFPLNYAIIDITTEVYGFEQTKKLVKLAFVCCLFFALIVPFIALLPSPENWPHQAGYTHVLGNVLRFFIANTIGIFIGITINGYLLDKWKIMMKGKRFWLRSISASIVGELVTSVIADIIAFIGTTSSLGVMKLMFGIVFIKIIYAFLLALPNSLIVIHIKFKSGNLVDRAINPFNMERHYNSNHILINE